MNHELRTRLRQFQEYMAEAHEQLQALLEQEEKQSHDTEFLTLKKEQKRLTNAQIAIMKLYQSYSE